MKVSVKWKLWITTISVLKRLLSFRNNTGPQNTLPRMTPLPVFLNTIVVQCSRYTLLFMSIVLVTIMMTTLYGHYLRRVVHSYRFLCSSLSILAFPEAHPLVPGDASYWQTLSVFNQILANFRIFSSKYRSSTVFSPLSFWNCNKPYDLLHPSSKSLYSFVFIFLFLFRH